jgi:hypothetical protein
MRPNAHFEFTVTTRTQPLTLFSKAPDRGRHRPHAHYSSPHPRAVQLPVIGQQIASALPLAQ